MLIPSLAMVFVYLIYARKYFLATWISFVLLIFYIILNAIFFTILLLLQYYLFQHFDKDGKQRSDFLFLNNLIIYFIFALPSLLIYIGEVKFILTMSFFIIIFAIVASIFIYEFSPKALK